MKIVLDPSFAGSQGMLKVWNATSGSVQVTEEGHLLGGHQTAWVAENPTLSGLLAVGHVAVVGGAPSAAVEEVVTPKKVSKSKAKQEEPAPTEQSAEEVVPAAPAEEPETNTEEPNTNTEETI